MMWRFGIPRALWYALPALSVVLFVLDMLGVVPDGLFSLVVWSIAGLMAATAPRRRRATAQVTESPEKQRARARLRELAATAAAGRDRIAWIMRTNALEAENDIERTDYSAELAEWEAQLPAIEDEIADLRAVLQGPAPDPGVLDPALRPKASGCGWEHCADASDYCDGTPKPDSALGQPRYWITRDIVEAIANRHPDNLTRQDVHDVEVYRRHHDAVGSSRIGQVTGQDAEHLKALLSGGLASEEEFTRILNGAGEVVDVVSNRRPLGGCTCARDPYVLDRGCPVHRITP